MEWLSDDCINHIYEPLTWHFVHVTVFGKVVRNFWIFLGRLKYAGNVEVLIMRGVEHLDIVAFDATRLLETGLETYYLRFPVTRSLRK